MSTNKKFRIQNGADIHGGGLSIDDVIVIGADGKVVAGAIQEAVAELTAADIADLQAQVTAILGTSPETLDTLQEIVTAFQDADTNLVASVASNSSDIATINDTLQSGVATPSDIAALEATIGDTELLPPAPPTFDGRLVVQSKSGPSDYPEAIHIYDPENPTTPISIVNPAADGEHAWDRFGESVAQNGSVLAVASPAEELDSGSSSLGVVWIYDTNDLSVAPTPISPPKTNTGFGGNGSIALSSTHLFVGAPWWYTPSTRQEFLDLGDWTQRNLQSTGAVLIYSLADLSADPVVLHSDSPSSSGSSTGFGYSVEVSDNKLIVGSINDLIANGGLSTDDENTAPHGGGSSTIFDISGGGSSLTSSSYTHKLTAQSSAPGWKNFGKFSFVDGDDLWISTGSPSYGSAGTTYNLPVGNVAGSIHKFSLSNPTSTPIVSFTTTDFGNGGSASDYFGENIAFTDTHVIVTAHGLDNGGQSMSGFVCLYNKSSGNKSSLNFPPNHVTRSAEFGRSIAVVDDKLYVSRYVTYGQDTNTSNATPNGNGEVWVYDTNNLSSTPTALYEANLNSNEEFGLSLHKIGMPVASVGQLTVAQSINELQSEIDSLSSLQSGDTSSLTSAIATAKSEAISTAATDATTKADAAEASAKAHADAGDASLQGQIDIIVGSSPASLDTLQEIVTAFENADGTLTGAVAQNASDIVAEASRATAAESANAAAIAAANSRTSGISTSSGSSNIEMAAEVDMDSNKVTNMADPTAAQDAATMAYVDAGDSASVSTAAADATSKADAAEASAKAYADQVVAATVDAAPAALDTLNELAAALGDDENFASTVTASISTKADDAATTAALDLKEDKTVVADLDTFVKGPGSYSLSNDASTNIESWGLGNGASRIGYSNGALSWSMDDTSATGGFNYQQNSLTYHAMSNLVVGTDYVLTITSPSRAGNLTVVVGDSSNTVDASVVMPAGNTPVTSQIEFTASANFRIIALDAASTGVYSISSIQVTDAETLQTSATQVVPAINEVHAELDALSATQSGDTSSLTTAIATAKSEAISTASADATAKADAAETDAKAYADQVVAATVDAAPAALDTLNELAAALGDDANFASTVTASIATKASQVDHDAEVARATAAEGVNASAIAATNARTSGISTSSGSTDIKMNAEVDMDSNNIKNANDVYAARGFIDTIESNDLKVQTGTVDFEGSIVNFGSSTITGGGFGNATKAEIDQHLNIPTANAGEFVKWTGTDYEWTDLVSGRLATDQLQIASGGSITATGPGGTFDFQDGIVMLSGSDVRVDTPTDVGQAANKGYVDAETTLVAGDGISIDNLTHTVSLDGSAISQNLVPDSDNVYTLGSPDKVWKDVYIGPGSLYIGGQKVIEDNSGTITINADPNQNLTVQTTGTGGLNVQSTGSGGISIDAASEAVQVKSDMVVSVGKTISTVGGAATKFGGDIDMQTNTVSGLGAPSMDADAATKLYVDDRIAEATISGGKTFSDDVIISGNLTVSGTTTTVNSETISLADNIIDLNSNLTSGAPSEDAGIRIMRGDASAVQLRWNETSDHWETYNGSAWTKIALSTSDLAEGSNHYFTEERAKACLTGGLCITYSSVTGEIKVDQAEAESTLRVAESVASDDADKLDGQEGTYYRINVYNVAGTLVN